MTRRVLAGALRERLAAAAHADGCWGYYRGQSSRLEPSAWASMALAGAAPAVSRDTFVSWQRADGHLIDSVSPQPNFAWDGLALLALLASPASSAEAGASIARLSAAIVAAKGLRLPNGPEVRQDQRIQAWSWVDGTFSWAEPTAWCLLALKRSGAADAEARARIADGERMLFDRVCVPGGWNYGNSNVFRQDLRPYVPTTALGLLALADHSDREEVRRSLAWLEASAVAERSAMALSLAAAALHVYGRPVSNVLDALADAHARTAFLDNSHLTAMALYALTIDTHGAAALRVPVSGEGGTA